MAALRYHSVGSFSASAGDDVIDDVGNERTVTASAPDMSRRSARPLSCCEPEVESTRYHKSGSWASDDDDGGGTCSVSGVDSDGLVGTGGGGGSILGANVRESKPQSEKTSKTRKQ